MSVERGPEAWVTAPSSEREQLKDGKHEPEVTYGAAPAECQPTSHVHRTRDQVCRTNGNVTFRLENENSLPAGHSSYFTEGPCPDPQVAENEKKMPALQTDMSPSKDSTRPCESRTRWTVGGTVGRCLGSKYSLELWETTVIPQALSFLREISCSRNGQCLRKTGMGRRPRGHISWVILITRRMKRPEAWIKPSLAHVGCSRGIKSK